MMTPEQHAAHEAALTSAAQAVWSSKNFSEKDQGQTLADRPDGIRTRYTQDAATAVTEYQRHMAADVRAAVDDLRTFAIAYGDAEIGTESAATYMRKIDEAERALLDLCGATREEVE